MLKNWLSLGVFVLALFLLINLLWPRDKLFTTQLELKRWPYSPTAHLKMSQTYFDTGYEAEAQKEYQKTQQLYQTFSFLDFDQNTRQKLEQTGKLVYSPQQIREKIKSWEEILKQKPYFREVLLQLAALHYQLFENQKAQNYWQQAFYLDPNNTLIQQVGQIINQ